MVGLSHPVRLERGLNVQRLVLIQWLYLRHKPIQRPIRRTAACAVQFTTVLNANTAAGRVASGSGVSMQSQLRHAPSGIH
ncbi:MAG: hypothetical protein ABI947_19245 [Chloroflexota bacterium]